jgi:hypothetical protein
MMNPNLARLPFLILAPFRFQTPMLLWSSVPRRLCGNVLRRVSLDALHALLLARLS